MKYVVAIDEGTTSVRSCVYDLEENKIVNISSRKIAQYYPQPSFVEEDAEEIYEKSVETLKDSLDFMPNAKGIGITNQRETVIAWSKKTGKPLYNAIVWQCRRTKDYALQLEREMGETIRKKTGLKVDAYFSATKIKWLLDNVKEVKEALKLGDLLVGTVDSYLIYRLTKGKVFATDYTNASRTMLFNINTLSYDEELLKYFDIPLEILPEVLACDGNFGSFEYNGKTYPICGVAGDQQSAMIGQCCFDEGSSKITYGTGLFLLYNIGEKPVFSNSGLLTTIGYRIGNKTVYALEGSVFNAGSTIEWLKEGLGLIEKASDMDKLASEIEDNQGVYLVPAFTGLGAPYWNSNCTGMLTGITRATTKSHICRATLEAMAYGAEELLEIMCNDSGICLKELRVDGGCSASDLLMQFQADLSGANIVRPCERESTVVGAAFLAGLSLKLITVDEFMKSRKVDKIFKPQGEREKYLKMLEGYQKAVGRCIYEED